MNIICLFTKNITFSKKKICFLGAIVGVLQSISLHSIHGAFFRGYTGKTMLNWMTCAYNKVGWYREYRFLNKRAGSLLEQRSNNVAMLTNHQTSQIWHNFHTNKKSIKKLERYIAPSFQSPRSEYIQRLCFGKEGLSEKRALLKSLYKEKETLIEKLATLEEKAIDCPSVKVIDEEIEQIRERLHWLYFYKTK